MRSVNRAAVRTFGFSPVFYDVGYPFFLSRFSLPQLSASVAGRAALVAGALRRLPFFRMILPVFSFSWLGVPLPEKSAPRCDSGRLRSCSFDAAGFGAVGHRAGVKSRTAADARAGLFCDLHPKMAAEHFGYARFLFSRCALIGHKCVSSFYWCVSIFLFVSRLVLVCGGLHVHSMAVPNFDAILARQGISGEKKSLKLVFANLN